MCSVTLPRTNTNNNGDVTTLSLSGNGQLLCAGQYFTRQLHIYNTSNLTSHVATINLPGPSTILERLKDSTWLPLDTNYILYTTLGEELYHLSITSAASVKVNLNDKLFPEHFSVSQDNVIYATNDKGCVIQSRDGVTWHQAVKDKLTGEICQHAIRVTTYNQSDNMWVIVQAPNKKWLLRIYAMNNSNSSSDYLAWRNVNVPAQVQLFTSQLAYDGLGNVFTTVRVNAAVHKWSVDGEYVGMLSLSKNVNYEFRSLVIDMQRHVMYVGQDAGTINVFALRYRKSVVGLNQAKGMPKA